MKWLALAFCLLATVASADPARMSVSGVNILDANGQIQVPDGFSENYNITGGATNSLPTDPGDMIAQGVTNIRIRVGFWNRTNCADPPYPTDTLQDAYNPSATATGLVDPTVWAPILQQVKDADAAIIASGKQVYIDFAMVGFNCAGDDTDPVAISAAEKAWLWIVSQLKQYHIGWWELMAEPNQGFTETDMITFYTNVINGDSGNGNPGIRSEDPLTPIMVGPTPVYNARYVAGVYLGAISNIIYTVDMYEPGPYVNQVLNGTTCPSASCFAYPGIFKDRPFLNASPCTFSLMGVTPGFLVYANRAWMDSLITCLTAFRTANGVPVWVNQFGAYNIQPGSGTWTADMANALAAVNIGADKWVWRQDNSNASYGGGNAIQWQAADTSLHTNIVVLNILNIWMRGQTVNFTGRR